MKIIQINYSPTEYQTVFHQDTRRFRIIVGGRRVGKSLCALHDTLAYCMSHPHALCWWVSPTLNDAREVAFEELKANMEEIAPAIRAMNETRMVIKFMNGSRLMFKGAENETSLRGRGLDRIVVDEAAFIKPLIWKRTLRPALLDKQGSAVITTTPNGRNWLHEHWEYANKYPNIWGAYHWPTSINPYIQSEELDAARAELSDIDYRQEFLAEFVSRAGMVYSDFSDNNIINSFTLTEYHDIYCGADFGFANPTAIAFLAVDRRDGRVTQFAEVYKSRHTIEQILQEILKVCDQWRFHRTDIKAIYSDPAGNAEELTSGVSPVDHLRMTGGFNVINRGSQINPGVALVRSFIKSADNTIRFRILNTCTQAIASFRGYAYDYFSMMDMVKEEPKKDGFHDHMCDAVRYFFINKFDKAKWIAKDINQTNYLANDKTSIILKKCSTCRRPFTSKTPKDAPPFLCKECREKIENANRNIK